MKEDYLWDKTGKDLEIEKLENALQVFRYRESVPPVLPAKVSQFEKQPRRMIFRFAFAFAAGLAVLALSLGIWLQAFNDRTEDRNNLAGTVRQRNIEPPDSTPAQETFNLPILKEQEKNDEPEAVKVKNAAPKIVRRNKPFEKNKKPAKPQTIKLTEEEKYAYDQLMLALSITSSQLRLVKDKVNGVEEQNAVLEPDDKNTRRK